MKKFFKVFIKIIMVLVIVLLSITMLVISVNSEQIPDMTVKSLQTQQAALLKGNYNWKAFTQVLKQENYYYNFKNENTIFASPGETVTVEMTGQVGTRRLYEVKNIHYIDSMKNTYMTSSIPQENPIDSYTNRYIEQIIMPDREDTYYYYLTLDYFEKGEVEYAFKVIVSTDSTYDVEELIKYKKTSIQDYQGIQTIISILPYSKNITNVMVRSSAKPTRLLIHYSEFIVDREQYKNNNVALFALIPELDIIEYSSPDGYYYFTRDEAEFSQGRSLEEYADNPELWKEEVLYKEKMDVDKSKLDNTLTKLIVSGLELESGEMIDLMSIDENSFRELLKDKISEIYFRKMYESLNEYAKTVINIEYSAYKSQNHTEPFIMLIKSEEEKIDSGDTAISSGDKVIRNLHNVQILVNKNKKEIIKNFKLYLIGDEWIISEVY